MGLRSHHYLIFCALFLASFWCGVASADESGSTLVVVKGVPLAGPLQDLPGSATVLNASEILGGGADFLQNQIQNIPNMNWSGGTSRPRFFQIRGVGDLEQFEGAPNSSVAVILDDVDVTGVGAALTLFDISQFEVHRGPQPVRFGSSALAGALHLTTTEPTEFTTGQAQFTLGNDLLAAGGGAVGGEMAPDVEFRVSAFGHSQDGFRHNEYLGSDSTNEREEFTGRAAITYTPSATTSITLSTVNAELDNGYDAFSIQNQFVTQTDRPGHDKQGLRLVSLKGVTELTPDSELTSITSFYRSTVDFSFDGDWGNNPFWSPYDPYDYFSATDRDRDALAQQFRVVTTVPVGVDGRELKWLNGTFLQSLTEDTNTSEYSDNIEYDFLGEDYRANTFAAFSNVSIPIAEDFTFSLGGRIEHRDTAYDDSRGSSFDPSDVMLGGSSSLEYTASTNSNWYMLASRGFRGGGFNAGPSVPGDFKDYNPEGLINLEAGNRAKFLDGSLLTSLNAFTQYRQDQQVRFSVQDNPSDPLSFTFVTDNAANGRSIGLETENTYQVSDRFRLRAVGSLLRSELIEVDDTLASLEGRDQSHAPRWQYGASGQYSFTQAVALELGVTGRAAFYFDDGNNARSSPYHLLNATLSYTKEAWEFRLWGRNLTNKEYAIRGFFFGNEPPDFTPKEYTQLGDPLSVGLTAIYRF